MTPEKQRIAIAEHLGFKPGTFITETHWFDDCVSDGQEEVLFADHTTGGAQVRVPEFLKDLNAMHEAEKRVMQADAPELLGNYHAHLIHVMDCQNCSWRRIHATAAQRAEAFLKTVGKWEGSE
jgi:hypothetical protein